MIPTLQFLVAEYLQIHGAKLCEELAKRFGKQLQNMRGTLRQMRAHGYITSNEKRPLTWTFVRIPPKNGAIKIPHKRRARAPQPQAIFAGFGRPDLSALAAMPVVRL